MLPTNLTDFLFRLLVGPALPGALFLLLGSLVARHPPRKLNNYYGYRTRRSMLNQDTWTVANQFSTTQMIRMAKPCILLGVVGAFFVPFPAVTLVAAGATLVMVALILVLTEKRLISLFDSNGHRRTY